MKTITVTLITLALCALVGAQEAKIMILERRDTDTLKSAYAEYKAAQKRWETAKYDVAKRYTTVDGELHRHDFGHFAVLWHYVGRAGERQHVVG